MKFIKYTFAIIFTTIAVIVFAQVVVQPYIVVTTPSGIRVRVTNSNYRAVLPPPTSASAVMNMFPSTQFRINGAALMPARNGLNTLRVQPTTSVVTPNTEGDFRLSCDTSHMAFDDPVVYPGQPGKSHLHVFFGNTSVTGNSDVSNLANVGNSTCAGGIMNRSGYWVPAPIDTTTGRPVVPWTNLVYYKGVDYYGVDPILSLQRTVPVPGLRMIAGSPSNAVAGSSLYTWTCQHVDGSDGPSQDHIPGTECENGSDIIFVVFFPQCWDGVHLDSPNHQSHMAYEGLYGCPADHPVLIPVITFNIHYPVSATSRPENWRLSSDTYSTGLPAGYSSHGDWVNGWNQTFLTKVVNNCLKPRINCGTNLLGDGTEVY